MEPKIELLQFIICRQFKEESQDHFSAASIVSNVYVPKFPHKLDYLHAVTCWRKDSRFHKEVIEYETEYGDTFKSPHMDIEPAKGSVYFRWHAHQFPRELVIQKSTALKIRVVLDWEVKLESYIMVEESGSIKT